VPDGFTKGHFVSPTVFVRVSNDSTIAREEVSGPMLSITSYEDEGEAIRIANETPYGLAAYIFSG